MLWCSRWLPTVFVCADRGTCLWSRAREFICLAIPFPFPPRSCSIQTEITHLPPCPRRVHVIRTSTCAFKLCCRGLLWVCPCMCAVPYTRRSRPHPFLISVWSIAGCCDAVRGEPCRSWGIVTFQWTGITLLTFLLWLEFNPRSPRDDLTLFSLCQDALTLLCCSGTPFACISFLHCLRF